MSIREDVMFLARAGFSRAEINALLSSAPAQQAPATIPAAQPAAPAAVFQPAAPATVPAAPAPASAPADRLGQLITQMEQQQVRTDQVLQAVQQSAIQQGYQPQPADTIDALTARIVNPPIPGENKGV